MFSTTNGLFYYEWTQHSLVALFGCDECLMFHECYSFTTGLFYHQWQQDSLVALFWLRWVANLPQMQFYHEWSLRCLFALFAMIPFPLVIQTNSSFSRQPIPVSKNYSLDGQPSLIYRVAKTHRKPHLYRLFSAKVSYNSFAVNDLQLKAFYAFSPLCTQTSFPSLTPTKEIKSQASL